MNNSETIPNEIILNEELKLFNFESNSKDFSFQEFYSLLEIKEKIESKNAKK